MTWTTTDIELQLQLGRCNYEQRRTIFDDEDIFEGFKNLRDIDRRTKRIKSIFDKRLKLLEASQFRQNLLY